MFSICRSRLLAIPSKTGGRVPLAVAPLVDKYGRAEIYDALTELSETEVVEESKKVRERSRHR